MRRVSDGYLEGLRVFVNKLDKKDVDYGEEYLTSLGATFSVDVVTALIAIFIMMTLRVAPHKKLQSKKTQAILSILQRA